MSDKEELGTVGQEEEGSSSLIIMLLLLAFYLYGPSSSVFSWIFMFILVVIINLYVNQEKMLYVPSPNGLARQVARNPPQYRSPNEVGNLFSLMFC